MTTKTQSNSLLAAFFEGVKQLATKLMPQNERAVSTWAIMNTVQKQLDAQGTLNKYGDLVSNGYALDTYIDDTGTYVIVARDGKLYKIPVTVDAQSQIILGPEQEVFMEFSPVSRSIMIQRQADGKVRWFAMPASTAFLNRSGEIDSRQLFDSFIEFAERTNTYPELDFYHLGERLVLGQADLLFRDDVNFCASGLFDDSDIARAAINALETDGAYWGLSIAYLPTKAAEVIRSQEGVEIPVYNDGFCRFISLLPEDAAASINTAIDTKEIDRMNKKQEEALRALIGDDTKLFDSIKEKLDTNNRAAMEPGVIVRQTAPAKPATPAAAPAQTPAAPVKREITAEDITALLDSDAFKNKVNAIRVEAKATESSSDDEDGNEQADDAPAAEEKRSLESLLTELIGELKTANTERAQTADDMPAKMARLKVIRPRATIQPQDIRGKEREKISLAEIANQTLEKIGAAE